MHAPATKGTPAELEARPADAAAWPALCLVCGRWSRAAWCSDCEARFAAPRPRCRRCALPVGVEAARCGGCSGPDRDEPAFDAAVAAVDYGFPWDGLVAAFKFQGRAELAAALATRLVETVQRRGGPLPDLVVPVPLAPARLAERGFDQAWELARRVAAALSLPAEAGALARIADTGHQTALGRAGRRANLARAFIVPPPQRGRIAGRRIAVVDDVMTTGATLDAAAAELRRAGAAGVEAWVFARTPAPGAA